MYCNVDQYTLSNQLNIYHDKLEHDAAHLNMPGGVDVNNHEDIFRALMEKVPTLFVSLLWMPPRDFTHTCVHGSLELLVMLMI